MKMETRLKSWLMGLCFAGLMAASQAQAGFFTGTQTGLTFDENGNSTGYPGGGVTDAQVTDNLPPSGYSPVGLGQYNGDLEPSGGGATTLDYLMPEQATHTTMEYGWVVVYGPAGSPLSSTIEDLIHFDNSHEIGSTIYDSIFYYSMEGSGNLANNWVSSSILTAILGAKNTVSVTEAADGTILYNPLTIFGSGETLSQAESAPGYNMTDNSGFAADTTQQYTYDFDSVVSPSPSPSVAPESITPIEGALMLLLSFGGMVLWNQRPRRA